MSSLRTPIIAIVGRPNVGKSTLFNKIVGERIALVDDQPGVTRDRNYAFVETCSIPFYLVDTGGFEKDPEEPLYEQVVEQTKLATEEADIVLALFDGKVGLQPGDEDVVSFLRACKAPVYYAVNKCDGKEHDIRVGEFYALGVDELHNISALRGRNVEDLIEKILESLPQYESLLTSYRDKLENKKQAEVLLQAEIKKLEEMVPPDEDDELWVPDFGVDEEEEEETQEAPNFAPVFEPGGATDYSDPEEYIRANKLSERYGQKYGMDVEESDVSDIEVLDVWQGDSDETLRHAEIDCIKVAIIGRPNVGKSTLLNKLVGEQRAITSDIAGTTRDTVHVKLRRDNQDYLLVDTAGLRKQGKVSDKLEKYSTMRSLRAISQCDVALVLLDASTGPVEQDAKIVGIAHEEGKGIVFAVNKWDLLEKDHTSVTKFKQQIRDVFKFSPYAPVIFISALTGLRCPKVIDTVKRIATERTKRVPTNKLNRILKRALIKHPPPVYRGRPVKLYYGVQVDVAPPRIALFFNYPKEVHFSYSRYIKNHIRDEFSFEGTDIKFDFRKR